MNEQQLAAVKQALEAVIKSDVFLDEWHGCHYADECDELDAVRALNAMAITDLQALIDEQTAQPAAWVDLTDAEIMHCMSVGSYIENGRAIAAALREKNAAPQQQGDTP